MHHFAMSSGGKGGVLKQLKWPFILSNSVLCAGLFALAALMGLDTQSHLETYALTASLVIAAVGLLMGGGFAIYGTLLIRFLKKNQRSKSGPDILATFQLGTVAFAVCVSHAWCCSCPGDQHVCLFVVCRYASWPLQCSTLSHHPTWMTFMIIPTSSLLVSTRATLLR